MYQSKDVLPAPSRCEEVRPDFAPPAAALRCWLWLVLAVLLTPTALAQTSRAYRGDFDGDRKTDLAYWNFSDGVWTYQQSSNGAVKTQAWGSPSAPYADIPVLADYDGDGKTDLAVWRPGAGTWFILNSANGTIRSQSWGAGYAPYDDVPVVGDYDGDGKADLAVWRKQNGTWLILNSSNGTVRSQSWGSAQAPYNDIPVAADYDGDKKTDVAVWRPGSGGWFILNSSNGAVRTQTWGSGNAPYNDVPLPADYDGDGKADLAVWRTQNGTWFVLKSSDGGYTAQQWGAAGAPYNDVALPADYDGDGKADVVVWRPATASWHAISSRSGGTLTLLISALSEADAIRLVEQSTFGPTDALVARARTLGATGFVEEQLNAPISSYPAFQYYPTSAPVGCQYESSNPTGPSSLCNRDNYSLFQVQLSFFQQALNGQDQLRQRVAFALSQILVVSGTEISQAYGMANYQQMLRNNAFGNFRQLLTDVTLSPVMGRYLDMVNNDKPNPARGTEPNENYARELLQLFSIGEIKLNQDGSPQLDASGQPIPAYDQEAIEGFAHVFTGWTYPPLPGATPQKYNPINYSGPMVVWPSNHDTGPKQLLNGVVLPASQTPEADLNAALDNIFYHPNVGPFIGKQLIQHLVTSNPSPAYISRVAAVFNNNGSGVRGDLKAVVRAILLDPEARGDVKTEQDYGHLREPILYALNVIRALNGISDGVWLRGQMSNLGQNLFTSPSVFNYYPPDYNIPGTTLLGPVFALMHTNSALARANFINSLVYTTSFAPDPTVQGATGTRLDLAFLQAQAGNPAMMVETLNTRMLHGTMSTQMKNAIITAVNAISANDTLGRARAAAYLVATSSQYQVER
jgi:uncharacterized protein (DUF1800 family)